MSAASQRLAWLDLFRGVAVLGMIWTHSANTFLTASLQQTRWFHDLSYYHGLIAPAFFWISGFVRAHVTAGAPRPVLPTLKRLLLVWLVGYAMYVPWLDLRNAQAWCAATTVNVLHCLAVSGLLMLLAERCGRWRYGVATVLLLFFVGMQSRAESWHTGLLPLDQYFNRNEGSLFALFPWVGFGMAGFLTRYFWCGQADRSVLGVLVLGALLTFVQPWLPWPGGQPAFFLERLGWVMMAAVVVACVAQRIAVGIGWLRLAGRESLLLYIAHLMMIHALPLPDQTLEHRLGMTQSVRGVAMIFGCLLVASLMLGALNERRKQHRGC